MAARLHGSNLLQLDYVHDQHCSDIDNSLRGKTLNDTCIEGK